MSRMVLSHGLYPRVLTGVTGVERVINGGTGCTTVRLVLKRHVPAPMNEQCCAECAGMMRRVCRDDAQRVCREQDHSAQHDRYHRGLL